jgi:hypothetical protein
VYRAIRSEGVLAFLRSELGPLLISAVVANVFFKWGSFVLELGGFLAVWFVLSVVWDLVLGRLSPQLRKP